MKKELHILVGCADARDTNQIQISAIKDSIGFWKDKGIGIDFMAIRAAGSFITNDVFQDIRTIIVNYLKENVHKGDEVKYFVHIQTHGLLSENCSHKYISHIFDLELINGSPLNCGMLGAAGVGIELEKLILEKKLEYETPFGKKKIKYDDDIRILLRDVYAFDGYLAGDWLKSISFLRTHPREQKAKLEKMIYNDHDLHFLGIKITAGIQDYGTNALIRLDDGNPKAPWWDEVQKLIRERNKTASKRIKGQGRKQAPLAGLICMADPKSESRILATDYYFKLKEIKSSQGYLPNTIFNMTGSTFDIPETPFGPYVIAGFYYAVKHLHLDDQMIMGYDQKQTDRMMAKILNDPLMKLVVDTYNVNLIPINKMDIE